MNGANLFYGDSQIVPDLRVTELAQIDDPDSDYSFYYFWVFKHDSSGRVFYGIDSGCSCPSPFENEHFDGPDDTSFTEVTRDTFEQFRMALWGEYLDGDARVTDQKRDAENAVKAALGL